MPTMIRAKAEKGHILVNGRERDFIVENYEKGISINEIAKRVSKKYLYRHKVAKTAVEITILREKRGKQRV